MSDWKCIAILFTQANSNVSNVGNALLSIVGRFTRSSPPDSPAVHCPHRMAVRWFRLTGDHSSRGNQDLNPLAKNPEEL